MLSAMPLLQRRLERLQCCDNISIVFPDDGAFKRFDTFFSSGWPTVVCNKIRDGEKRIINIRDGNEFLCIIIHKYGSARAHTHTHTHNTC